MRLLTLVKLPSTLRNVRRVRRILSVLARHGFGEVVDHLGLGRWVSVASRLAFRRRAWVARSFDERVRVALEDLGPTFVKLGQVMATRPDLIPMSLVLELRRLQDDVPPFDGEAARAVIEEELGKPVEEIFAHFEVEPLAAASIAQVHRARLHDGRPVVVKVQRPGLQELMERDLHILMGLADLLHEKMPELRQIDLPGMAREFGSAMKVESDFGNELYNIQRFVKLWAEDPDVNAPEPHPELSAARVLTMELIDGAKVTDLEALKRIGAEPRVVARRGTYVALRSIFEHGFFHADPHPGNFFVLPGSRITLIDFGMMGTLDRDRLDELLSFLVAILIRDPEMMVRLFMDLELIDDGTDLRRLKREVKALLDRWADLPIGEVDIGTFIGQVFEVMARHKVGLPADLLLVGKAIATMEGIAQEIDPGFDPIAEMRPYLLRIYALRVLDPRRHARAVARSLTDVALLLRHLPDDLRAIAKKVRRGQMRVVVSDEEAPWVQRRADRRTNRALVTVVGVAGLLSGVFLYASGQGAGAGWAFALAAVAGAWSLLGIFRSGGV